MSFVYTNVSRPLAPSFPLLFSDLLSLGLDVDRLGVEDRCRRLYVAHSADTPERPRTLRIHGARPRRNRAPATSCVAHTLGVLILRPRGNSRCLFQPNPDFANSEAHTQHFSRHLANALFAGFKLRLELNPARIFGRCLGAGTLLLENEAYVPMVKAPITIRKGRHQTW